MLTTTAVRLPASSDPKKKNRADVRRLRPAAALGCQQLRGRGPRTLRISIGDPAEWLSGMGGGPVVGFREGTRRRVGVGFLSHPASSERMEKHGGGGESLRKVSHGII